MTNPTFPQHGPQPTAETSADDGGLGVGSGLQVRPATEADRAWIRERSVALFGADIVVSRGAIHRPAELPAVVAWDGPHRVGLATWRVDRAACELVTLDALRQWQGVGTALLTAVQTAALEAGCRRLWLITTNDNVDALRFYQRRGLALAAIHIGALAESRRLKPEIPEVGAYGIALRDELELDMSLSG